MRWGDLVTSWHHMGQMGAGQGEGENGPRVPRLWHQPDIAAVSPDQLTCQMQSEARTGDILGAVVAEKLEKNLLPIGSGDAWPQVFDPNHNLARMGIGFQANGDGRIVRRVLERIVNEVGERNID